MGRSVLLLLVFIGVILYKVQGQEYNATDCPHSCVCEHISYIHGWDTWGWDISNGMSIQDCQADPYTEIMRLIKTYPTVDGLQLTNTLSHTAGRAVTKLFTQIGALTSLKVLDISSNNLTEIPDSIDTLPELELFKMSKNHLTTLPWQAIRAQVVIASHNHITYLDMSSLVSQPHREVILSNNAISSLGIIPPTTEPNWKTLDLSNNRLKSLDAWFFRIGISSSGYQYETRLLNVSNNSIFRFTNSNGYPSLPYTSQFQVRWSIDLSHNDIVMRPSSLAKSNLAKSGIALPNGTFLLPQSYDHYQLLWKIDISHNRIQYLHDVSDAMKTNQKVLAFFLRSGHMNLANNPLRCDCVDYSIYQDLKIGQNPPSLSCGAPEPLRGHSIASVDLDQFRCTTELDCPDGCICTDIPSREVLTVVCHHYTGKTLPSRIPSPWRQTSNYKYTLDFEVGSLVNLVNWDYLTLVENASFSHNHIEHIPPGFFDNQKKFNVLRLDNNNIQTLPLYIDKWPAHLYLGQNEWRCSCENQHTIQQIKHNKDRVVDYQNVTCSLPEDRHIGDISCSETKTQNILEAKFIVPLIVVCTLFIVGVLSMVIVYAKRVWIYRMFRWHPFHRADAAEAEKEFDVFISYCDGDSNYIENDILPRLEELGFKVCHHKVHFKAGESIIWNIHNAIMNSKRTLIFFSMAYMDSGLCMYEFYTALTLQVMEGCSHLVTIKDTVIDVKTLEAGMRSFFEHYVYIERESPQFWDKLLYVLPVERMNAPEGGNANHAAQNGNEFELAVINDGDE